jgi:hypothetical protein
MTRIEVDGPEYVFRQNKRIFLLFSAQNGSGVHPTPFLMGNGGFYPDVKGLGGEAEQ